MTCNKCIKHIDVETLSINKEVVTQGKVHAIEMRTDQILSVEERNDEKEDNVENENTEPGNESEQQTNEEEVEKEQDVIREKEKGEGNENDNDNQMDKNNEREGTDDQEGPGSRQLECEDNQTGKNNEKAIETEQLVVSEEVSESEKENGGTTNTDQNDMNQGNDHLEANIIEVTNQNQRLMKLIENLNQLEQTRNEQIKDMEKEIESVKKDNGAMKLKENELENRKMKSLKIPSKL